MTIEAFAVILVLAPLSYDQYVVPTFLPSTLTIISLVVVLLADLIGNLWVGWYLPAGIFKTSRVVSSDDLPGSFTSLIVKSVPFINSLLSPPVPKTVTFACMKSFARLVSENGFYNAVVLSGICNAGSVYNLICVLLVPASA